MGCPRCRGLLLEDGDESRCVNCGHRAWSEEEAMPRFRDEAHRQRWIESVRQAKAKRKAASAALQAELEPPAPRAVVVRPVAQAVMGLDDTIAQLQADLAVLEQAREILSRSSV